MPEHGYEPRPPCCESQAPAGGWLFAMRLRAPYPDMALAVSISGVDADASVLVEAVDPSWERPHGDTDFQILSAMKDNPPRLWVERAAVPAEAASRLLDGMRELGAAQLQDAVPPGGVDGWHVDAIVDDGRSPRHEFEAWSPSRTERTRHHAFVRHLLEAARAHVHEPDTTVALAKWDRFAEPSSV